MEEIEQQRKSRRMALSTMFQSSSKGLQQSEPSKPSEPAAKPLLRVGNEPTPIHSSNAAFKPSPKVLKEIDEILSAVETSQPTIPTQAKGSKFCEPAAHAAPENPPLAVSPEPTAVDSCHLVRPVEYIQPERAFLRKGHGRQAIDGAAVVPNLSGCPKQTQVVAKSRMEEQRCELYGRTGLWREELNDGVYLKAGL